MLEIVVEERLGCWRYWWTRDEIVGESGGGKARLLESVVEVMLGCRELWRRG